ncbi:MAG: phosphoenolpyruvate carboxylase [Caldilineales bacterium]
MRALRNLARSAGRDAEPLSETITAAVMRLRGEGASPAELQQLLDRLRVMPVLTAHPTEAKRRTVMVKLARIAAQLHDLDTVALTPDEWTNTVDLIAEEIAALWQTDETRSRQPSVLDEVRNSLYYIEHTLFELAPRLHVEMRRALRDAYPSATFACRRSCASEAGSAAAAMAIPSSPSPSPRRLRAQKALALRLYRGAIGAMYGTSQHLGAVRRVGRTAASLIDDAARFPAEAVRFADAIPPSRIARRWRSSIRSCWRPRRAAAVPERRPALPFTEYHRPGSSWPICG